MPSLSRNTIILLGALASVAIAEIYHGPMGAGEELRVKIEREARVELDRNEMGHIQARMKQHPLSRTLILSGPADDFQHRELVRVMSRLPGVASVRWDPNSLAVEVAPL